MLTIMSPGIRGVEVFDGPVELGVAAHVPGNLVGDLQGVLGLLGERRG